MLRVAICGASGYAGAELLRILSGHPKVTITAVTSEKSKGISPADLYGHLYGHSGLVYEPLDRKKLLEKADFFFMALPHAASQNAVNYFFTRGRKVVDLSADYRIRNHIIYERWYSTPHKFRKTLKQAVYGLPEIYRKGIRKASLIANPGCYPTGAVLGLLPLLRNKVLNHMPLTVTGIHRRSSRKCPLSRMPRSRSTLLRTCFPSAGGC
jgi:N-acetyl-gamma-glutamyl-phosphate reductase